MHRPKPNHLQGSTVLLNWGKMTTGPDKHENNRCICDIGAWSVWPKHAGRWSDSFKCGEMYRKLTLKEQGGTVINKEAWSYTLTTPLCPSCASVFTHPLKRGHQRTLVECLPSWHREVVRKVTVTLEAAYMVKDRWFQLPRLHFTAGCSLARGMETSRNLYRKFWTQRRMYRPGSSTSGPC